VAASVSEWKSVHSLTLAATAEMKRVEGKLHRFIWRLEAVPDRLPNENACGIFGAKISLERSRAPTVL